MELVLAVDASRSMEPFEQKIQRDGYIAAFRRKEVIDAIREGIHGRVARSPMLSGPDRHVQRMIVPWTLVDGAESAEKLAAALDQPIPQHRVGHRSPGRSISAAPCSTTTASRACESHRYFRRRRQQQWSPSRLTLAIRRLPKGITINGLPLMTRGDFYSDWAVKDLDLYYSNCVIGGPGAFMIPVNSWDQFPEAVRRKLVLELAGRYSYHAESRLAAVTDVAADTLAQDMPASRLASRRAGNMAEADAGLGIELSLGCNQLLAVSAFLLRRTAVEFTVALRKMRCRDKSAGDSHLDDRHG